MEYIDNIRYLMKVDFEKIRLYHDPAGKFVYLPARQDYFLGVRQPLLPKDICKWYVSETPIKINDNEYASFWSVIRLIQEDKYTRRIDFYGKQLEYEPESEADSLMLDSMKADIRQIMSDNRWTAQFSESQSCLAFRFGELEMTIMFELLADSPSFPFWNQLNAYPNIIWPPPHERSFHRYIHFVIRERRQEKINI